MDWLKIFVAEMSYLYCEKCDFLLSNKFGFNLIQFDKIYSLCESIINIIV